MRVLGIDPGSRTTGLGVVETVAGGLRAVDYRCLHLATAELAIRLGDIYRGVADMIAQHNPDSVVVEQVFVATNMRAALVLGHARGSAICAAVNAERPVCEYSALQVKQAVVGSGNAKKPQVQYMVRLLLGLNQTPPRDAADALACAICHIHTTAVTHKQQAAGAT